MTTDDPAARRDVSEAEAIARHFHYHYEKQAPAFGYTTREKSAVMWDDVPESNRNLMVSVVQTLLDRGHIRGPSGWGSGVREDG